MESSLATPAYTYNESVEVRPYVNGFVGARFVFDQRLEPRRYRREDDAPSNLHEADKHGIECSECNSVGHFGLFPRAVANVMEHNKVRKLQLSFSQGAWDHDSWGSDPDGGFAGGVDLWAYLPEGSTMKEWSRLVHELGGIYCASLGLMEENKVTSPAHQCIVPWDRIQHDHGESLFRGTLPRETMCTENLTPVVKLLPCRSDLGMGALLHPTRIFAAQYYAISVQAEMEIDKSSGILKTLWVRHSVQAVWAVGGRKGGGDRVSSITLYNLLVPRGLSTSNGRGSEEDRQLGIVCACSSAQLSEVRVYGPTTVWGDAPPLVDHVLLGGNEATKCSSLDSISIVVPPISSTSVSGALEIEHYIAAKGGHNGWVVSHIINHHNSEYRRVLYTETIPHFIEPVFSTLSVGGVDSNTRMRLFPTTMNHSMTRDIDGDLREAVGWITPSPHGKLGPLVLEASFTVPPGSVSTISYQFNKQFLTINDWPPDPSRGLDAPPPFVRFHCDGEYPSAYLSAAVYGVGPLLDAPQPDFAMPFNVLTLTCSLIAFFITTIVSILVRKSGYKTKGAEKFSTLLMRWQKLSSSVLPVQQHGKEKAE